MDASDDSRSSISSTDIEKLDEYTALQKYISTYRDPKIAAQENAAANAEDKPKKKAWQVRRHCLHQITRRSHTDRISAVLEVQRQRRPRREGSRHGS